MRTAVLALALIPVPAFAAGPWPDQAVRRMAADAALVVPPDLKRQLSKHAKELMAGTSAAPAFEPAAAKAEAARRARELASSIRRHTSFGDVARQTGALVALCAAASPPPAGDASGDALAASTKGRFLGYTAEPFAPPEELAGAALPAATSRAAYDAGVTRAARLLAWVWKTAGGDASAVASLPESKGPYAVRE